MLFSIIAVLAIVDLAFAVSPAQATYCSEDNLLRAFQHTLTPAQTYCSTQSGYPTFLAVQTYLPTRLSSACSCLSRFPTEGVPAAASTSCASLSGTSVALNFVANIIVKVNLAAPCAGEPGYYSVSNVCGTYRGSTVSFNSGETFNGPDDCFNPTTNLLTTPGLDFEAGGITTQFYFDNVIQITGSDGKEDDFATAAFHSAACGTC